MKLITFKNGNGRTEFTVTGFEVSSTKGEVRYLPSFVVEPFKDRPFYSRGSALLSASPFARFVQYSEGTAEVSLNEEGFATRGFVLEALGRTGDETFLPYAITQDLLKPITYGELGYLLTYYYHKGLDGVPLRALPSLGSFMPSDSRMKLSIISIEGVSSGVPIPEYRLGEYYSSSSVSIEDYLEEVRVSKRPVPVPLYYGYQNIFYEEDITGKVSLFGQVPRSLIISLVSNEGSSSEE